MSANPMNGEEITEALIDNILNTRFEDIAPEVIANSKDRFLDMIGDVLAGARGDGSAELAELVAGWSGKKEATVLGSGARLPAHEAAFVNCIFGRTFDRGPLTYVIDGTRSPNHITETSALTALAMGESMGIDGKELITAMVVGDDLAARLHIAIDRAQPGQTLPPGTPPPPAARGSEEAFAATAIAGRILGLNKQQMKDALGISTILTGRGGGPTIGAGPPPGGRGTPRPSGGAREGGPGWLGVNDPALIATLERGPYDESIGTKMSNGISARNGINAAQLAKIGWPGVEDPLFGDRGGHFPGLASVHHPDKITGGLGKTYYVEVCFKPYPGGRPTGAPTGASLALVNKHDINTDDIEEVILHLSPVATAAHYSKPYQIGVYPTMNALWSYYFVVASALYRKSATAENFTEAKIRDPKLQALIKKVKLAHLDKPEGIEVEVVMKDGRRFSEFLVTALGNPSNPLPRAGLIDKFREQVEFSQYIGQGRTDELLKALEDIEKVPDVKRIAELASRESRGA